MRNNTAAASAPVTAVLAAVDVDDDKNDNIIKKR